MEFRINMARWEVNGETGIWILKEVKVFDRWREWGRISLTDEECNRLGLRVEKNFASIYSQSDKTFLDHKGSEDEAEKDRHNERHR